MKIEFRELRQWNSDASLIEAAVANKRAEVGQVPDGELTSFRVDVEVTAADVIAACRAALPESIPGPRDDANVMVSNGAIVIRDQPVRMESDGA